MSIGSNKEIVLRRWYQELWNKWNIAVADELFTTDYRLYLSGVSMPADRGMAKQIIAMFRRFQSRAYEPTNRVLHTHVQGVPPRLQECIWLRKCG